MNLNLINLKFFIFAQTWQRGKLENADFKYDKVIFKLELKVRKSAIFGPKFEDFFLAPNFAIGHIPEP